MKEIRRRARVVGAFPDGQSCLNLAAARLRYIAATAWSAKCYMNMRPLYQPQVMQTGASPDQMCERVWTLPISPIRHQQVDHRPACVNLALPAADMAPPEPDRPRIATVDLLNEPLTEDRQC